MNYVTGKPLSVTLSSNGYDILASGTFITAGKDSAEICFEGLCFKLVFINSDRPMNMSVEGEPSGKMLTFRLENFSNPLGSGTSEPLEVGSKMGKKLYFSFYITAYDNESVKQVTYTFYSRG